MTPAGEVRASDSANGVPSRTSADRGLLEAARRGDREARDRLISSHLPLVRNLAARYRGNGLPLEDLVQEGSIGLLDAVANYDPDRSPSFEPYVRFRVRRAIRNALTDQARLIRHPKHIVERQRMLERIDACLIAGGKRRTPRDLAVATGLSLRAVLDAQASSQTLISLDEPVLPDGSPRITLVADPDADDPELEAIQHERAEALARALAQLTERQRRIVSARWGLNGEQPKPVAELSAELAVSPSRMRAIREEALYDLRDALEPAGVST